MPPENQEGTGSKFTTRQKLIAVGVVVVLLILIWQAMGLFSSSGSSSDITPTPTSSPGKTTSQNKPNMQMQMTGAKPNPAAPAMPMPVPAMTPPPGGAVPMMQQPAIPQPVQGPRDQASNTMLIMKEQQDEQKKYLSIVNELEMLRLQRDIAETNQAIAAAKLATVTAEKNINDLLTKPAAPVVPPVPAGDYANKLVSPVPSGTPVLVPGGAPPVPQVAAYTVISVSMQLNRWTAVLGYQGKLYNVSVGDVLPVDGSIVVSIGKEGVILRKSGVRKKISLVPVI